MRDDTDEEKNIRYLHEYYDMVFPKKFKDGEKIRLLAIHKEDDQGYCGRSSNITRYVDNFEDYKDFILKYRYHYDVYNQLTTVRPVRDRENGGLRYTGTKKGQRLRKVLFLDFDLKDHPGHDTTDAEMFSGMIKEKVPNLFLHACTMSGHGFHFYISVVPLVKNLQKMIELNRELALMTGADIKAVSPTQIDRPPCSYNHKQTDGTYDYTDRNKWQTVTLVNCAYEKGCQFKAYDLDYIKKLIKNARSNRDASRILEKQAWDYTKLDGYKRFLCNWRIFYEGADKGKRNFWHGRIVKTLQSEGYQPSKIYSMCREYNGRCRPPKSEAEIDADTKRYMETDYKLLGCYRSISDKTHMGWVKDMCDKAECGTFYNGAKISIGKHGSAKIHKSALKNKDIQRMTGHDYLILTMLDIYKDSYGRRGFRVKNLKDKLYSTVTKRQAINDRS